MTISLALANSSSATAVEALTEILKAEEGYSEVEEVYSEVEHCSVEFTGALLSHCDS